MRSLIFTLITLAGLTLSNLCLAQAPEPPAEIEAREIAIDQLLGERDSIEALNKAIESARKIGVSEQAILEGKFLYHVDSRNDAAIAAMLPDFKKQNEKFDIKESVIFATKEDWQAVVEYVAAIAALEKGDRDGFKEHIKEAFWLGPRQAAAFAPHIERLRLEEAMKEITIDFDMPLTQLDDLKPEKLSPHMKGKKAMLLHFWSPHSTECAIAMGDFAKTAEMLTKHKIAVASISTYHAPEDQKNAIAIAKPYMKSSGSKWYVEKEGEALGLGHLLRIQNLPTMVILSTEGKVMFNGDPTDEHFWDTLKEIDPKIDRPLTEGNYDQ